MSTDAVAEIIRARLTANWTATRIREPNTHFDPAGVPFVELRFPGSGVERGAVGDPDNPLWEEDGAFMVHVYVPDGSGEALARQYADAIADLYLRWDAPPSGLHIDERLPGTGGARDFDREEISGRWWGVSFGVTYRFQSIG